MSVRSPRSIDDAVSGVALAAGAANVIMQLSRPGVGYGVVESPVDSGKAILHPLKRSRTTFTYLAVALWGTEDERRTYRRAVNGSHVRIRSRDDSPVAYSAFDQDLQLWVAACLYRGLEDVHHAMYPDAGFRGDHGIYEACHVLGTTLQMRREMWPPDRDAFEIYWKDALGHVSIDAAVRGYLMALVDLSFMPAPIRRTLGPLHHFLTTGFLAPRFREEMHLAFTPADQRRFDRLMRGAGTVNALLPRTLRLFPANAYLAELRRRIRHGSPLV